MPIFYLIIATISSGFINVFSSLFVRKNPNSKNIEVLFNFLLSLSPIIAWGIFYAIEGGFSPWVLLYSLGFAASFVGTFFFFQLAVKKGPLSIISLFNQSALVLTAIWGLIFWNAEVNAMTIIGLIMILVSLALCVLKKEQKSVHYKWIIWAFLSMVCNAAAAILIKTEQIQFENQFGGEMMFFAMVIVAITLCITYLINKKNVEITNIKHTWWLPIVTGLCNFGANALVIVLVGTDLSPSIIYPVIGVGALTINILFSLFFYKEKLTIIQYIGMAVGAIAIVLLSI